MPKLPLAHKGIRGAYQQATRHVGQRALWNEAHAKSARAGRGFPNPGPSRSKLPRVTMGRSPRVARERTAEKEPQQSSPNETWRTSLPCRQRA